MAFELVKKPIQYSDLATKKLKRKSEKTKNEMMREMIETCIHNTLKFRFVLMSLAKAPTRTVRTQSNHVFMAIYATFKLECLSITNKLNPFALCRTVTHQRIS